MKENFSFSRTPIAIYYNYFARQMKFGCVHRVHLFSRNPAKAPIW